MTIQVKSIENGLKFVKMYRVCFLGYDVTNFEIKIIFQIKLFLYMIKKLRQKFKNLEN